MIAEFIFDVTTLLLLSILHAIIKCERDYKKGKNELARVSKTGLFSSKEL